MAESARPRPLWLPWLALIVLVVLPLYLAAAAVAFKADLFDFSGEIGDDQFKAVVAFLGGSLAATATLAAALLTRSHNARALALQREVERRAVLSREAEAARLTLDTVVRSLELIGTSDGYAPPAKVAGALATLVHLGHPVIAMLALGSAWEEGRVDCDTGCWLVSQAIEKGSPASALEAASLLVHHAEALCNDAHPSAMSWPESMLNQWPDHRNDNVRRLALLALCRILLARPADKVTQLFPTAARIAFTAMQHDSDATIRKHAAEIFLIATHKSVGATWQNDTDTPETEPLTDVRARAVDTAGASPYHFTDLADEIAALRHLAGVPAPS